MKRKYVRHYEDYAIGANEALYCAMAQKGWRLVRRGAWLSRFEKAGPEVLRYRIELASPAWLDEAELPEEQIAVYEDCGWSFVTKHGLTHVFCAPESSDAQEFYTDPRAQVPTLKALRRSYCWSWLWCIVIFGIHFLLSLSMSGTAGELMAEWSAELTKKLVVATSLMLWYGCLVVWALYQSIVGAVCTMRLHRRLKCGKPVDHEAKTAQRVLRWIETAIGVIGAIFLLMSAAQWLGRETYDLPQTADGPYLLLSDFGVEGERTTPWYASYRTSECERVESLLAVCYDTCEYVEADGKDFSLYHEVYELKGSGLTQRLAQALMADATFARSADVFEEVMVSGLDRAWRAGYETVAIRGNTVWYITLIDYEDVDAAVLDLLANPPE